MKPITFAAAAAAIALLAAPALAASPPKFTASCPSGSEVESDGKGTVKIDGGKAALKTLSGTAWQAKLGAMKIDIGRDGAQVFASESPKGDICEVTSSSAAPNSDGSMGGVPKSDQKACLKAVKHKTNNKMVSVLEARSSEANNEVIVGVGPDKAKWQCLVKNGSVAGVMSLTDEGAL
jgi:hypothetical protein